MIYQFKRNQIIKINKNIDTRNSSIKSVECQYLQTDMFFFLITLNVYLYIIYNYF